MKLLLLILIPLASFGQIDTVYHESLFVQDLSVGKPLRQSGQFLAIGATFATVGIASIIIGDAIRNPAIEVFGDVLTISSFPFVVIGINKLYIAGSRQELIEKYR